MQAAAAIGHRPLETGGQGFDGDVPIEARVARLIDFAHTGRAELFQNLVCEWCRPS